MCLIIKDLSALYVMIDVNQKDYHRIIWYIEAFYKIRILYNRILIKHGLIPALKMFLCQWSFYFILRNFYFILNSSSILCLTAAFERACVTFP